MSAAIAGAVMVDGFRLAYDERGGGEPTVVLLPGLLLSRRMQAPLADCLAAHGQRVICLDLLGHGESDRPVDPVRYSIQRFARHVVGALDALGIERAVIGGTSLGANVTLEVAVLAPERVAGIIVEGVWLDDTRARADVGLPLMATPFTVGRPVTRLAALATGWVPRDANLIVGLLLDWFAQDQAASAAYMRGVRRGRKGPPARERRTIAAPALVVGIRRDPSHPLSDSRRLIDELERARMVEVGSVLELRLRPLDLAPEIAGFIDECFIPAAEAIGDAA